MPLESDPSLLPAECVVSSREFLQHRWTAERPAFQRVLHALPLAEFAYSPHERSPSAAQILWTLALEARACSELIDARESNWLPDPPPAEPEKIVDFGYRAIHETADKAKTIIRAFYGTAPIHHRGQLSTYIRPMGGKVPSIYGPSGDNPGA